MNTKKLARRQRAISRLETTLKSGVKVSKDGKEKLPLSDADKSRIEKELSILKTKIV